MTLRTLLIAAALAISTLAGGWALAAAAGGRAFPAPEGWQVETEDGNVTWRARAASHPSNIALQFLPSEASKEPLPAWFKRQVDEFAAQGVATKRSGVSVEQDLYKDGFQLAVGKEKFRVYAFGWQTRQGKQAAAIMMLTGVPNGDAVAEQAFDHVASAWKQRVVLTGGTRLVALQPLPAARSAPAAAQRSPAPKRAEGPPSQSGSGAAASSQGSGNGSQGGRCREEMRTITTMQLQQVCYPSAGGMSNCQMQSVPVQQQVLQTQCY